MATLVHTPASSFYALARFVHALASFVHALASFVYGVRNLRSLSQRSFAGWRAS